MREVFQTAMSLVFTTSLGDNAESLICENKCEISVFKEMCSLGVTLPWEDLWSYSRWKRKAAKHHNELDTAPRQKADRGAITSIQTWIKKEKVKIRLKKEIFIKQSTTVSSFELYVITLNDILLITVSKVLTSDLLMRYLLYCLGWAKVTNSFRRLKWTTSLSVDGVAHNICNPFAKNLVTFL